jgi:hypothetical protein
MLKLFKLATLVIVNALDDADESTSGSRLPKSLVEMPPLIKNSFNEKRLN